MCLKNSSVLIRNILGYLRMNKNVSEETLNQIYECINILEETNDFKYIYRKYDYKLAFLENPGYNTIFDESNSYYLIAVTLGHSVEQLIKTLSKTDVSKMVIMDACASALLELKADEFEKTLGCNLTKRFCPGYGTTDILDLKIIHKELKADRIGIELNESCMMIPQKSMLGIIGIKSN